MSVLVALHPLIFIARLAGLSLFTIDAKTLQATVTRIDCLAITATSLVHLFFNFMYWRSVLGPDVDDITNDILEVSTPLLVYIDYLINAAAIVWLFAQRRRLTSLLRQFRAIDESLSMEFGLRLDYKRQRNRIGVLLVSATLVATLINTNDFVTSAGIKITSLEFYNFDIFFFLWNALCQIVQFCCFVVGMRAIRQRLSLVRHSLSDRSNAIRLLTRIHLRIARLIEDFNDLFAPIMFAHFADIFCWLCFLLFDIASDPWRRFFVTLALNIPHSVYMGGFVVATVGAAEGVRREASRILARLHEVGGEIKGEEQRREVFQLALQITTMPARFSCGLFDFDWKMLFKFMSAGLMYFIILMQLNKSFEGK